MWFPHSTPKYSFLAWVAIKNRLQTGDRILQWNRDANGVCVLCHDALETHDHLFFGCCYPGRVWRELVGGITGDGFSTE